MPDLDVVEGPRQRLRALLHLSPGQPDRPARRSRPRLGHDATSGAVSAMPGDLGRHAGGDRLHDLLLRRLLPLVDADVAPEAQHGDPGRHLEDVVQVVRDEDDREPLLGETLHEVEHLLGLSDAERGGRLVEDDERGVPLHGLRDRDRLPLPARERGDRLADRPDRRHSEATSASPPCAAPSRAP